MVGVLKTDTAGCVEEIINMLIPVFMFILLTDDAEIMSDEEEELSEQPASKKRRSSEQQAPAPVNVCSFLRFITDFVRFRVKFLPHCGLNVKQTHYIHVKRCVNSRFLESGMLNWTPEQIIIDHVDSMMGSAHSSRSMLLCWNDQLKIWNS